MSHNVQKQYTFNRNSYDSLIYIRKETKEQFKQCAVQSRTRLGGGNNDVDDEDDDNNNEYADDDNDDDDDNGDNDDKGEEEKGVNDDDEVNVEKVGN